MTHFFKHGSHSYIIVNPLFRGNYQDPEILRAKRSSPLNPSFRDVDANYVNVSGLISFFKSWKILNTNLDFKKSFVDPLLEFQ